MNHLKVYGAHGHCPTKSFSPILTMSDDSLFLGLKESKSNLNTINWYHHSGGFTWIRIGQECQWFYMHIYAHIKILSIWMYSVCSDSSDVCIQCVCISLYILLVFICIYCVFICICTTAI